MINMYSMWMTVILLCCISLVFGKSCPSYLCECQGNGILDCAQKRLDRVPAFSKPHDETIKRVDLSQNDIYMVPHYAFGNMKVKELDISGNPLDGISPRAFTGIEDTLKDLDLHNCNIFVIHWSLFRKLTKLESLNLSTNGLFAIQKELLQNLVSLIKLDLSWNKLTRLDNSAFIELELLEELHLEGNAIANIDTSTFNSLRNLKKLSLRSNRVAALDPLSFRGLERLQELDLSDNILHMIPTEAFKQMSGLRKLQLDQNNITKIGQEAFTGAYKLETLTLSFNGIVNISYEGFLGLASLASLDLSSNQIESMGTKQCIFQNTDHIMELKLDGNPLQCTCVISWVGHIIDGKKTQVTGTCRGPAKYINMPITRVDFSLCENKKLCVDKNKVAEKGNNKMVPAENRS